MSICVCGVCNPHVSHDASVLFFIVGLFYLADKLGAIVVLGGRFLINGFNNIICQNISV